MRIGIVEIEEVPLSYRPGDATRFRVKAVGDRAGRSPMPRPLDGTGPQDLAVGAAVRGTGGGPSVGRSMIERCLDEGLLAPDELADDAFVVPTAMTGASTVLVERIPSGDVPAMMRTPEALDVLGPEAFGLGGPFTPIKRLEPA